MYKARLPPATRVAACKTLDDALEWAEELGVRGTLQDLSVEAAWDGSPSEGEREDMERLQADARHRALHAKTPAYAGRLVTCLHWVALFRLAYPHWVLFLPLHEHGTHLRHAVHNEDTLTTLRLFIQRHGSLQKGRAGAQTSSDAKAAVTSTLRAFRSVEARYDVCNPKFNQQLSLVGQQMRQGDRPPAERALAVGLRAQHIVQLHTLGIPISSFDNCLAWAMLQVCGRGTEPGLREGAPQSSFDPGRGVVWADFVWFSAGASGSEFPSLDLWWYPAKDGKFRHRKVPIPISRAHTGPIPLPSDPYDAIQLEFSRRDHLLPKCRAGCDHLACVRGNTAFFATDSGAIIDASYVEVLGKRLATALGMDPTGVGKKWARQGGATDIFEALGPAQGAAVLRQRGRWQRDTGQIYAKVSASLQLETSRRMTNARGADMTARSGWAQPAWRVV